MVEESTGVSRRRFEFSLNIVSVALIAFLAVSIAQRHFMASAESPQLIQVGQTLAIPGVQWNSHQTNLVLALSTGCRFCEQSVPFYRALMKYRSVGDWESIGLFPQAPSEAASYLKLAGYNLGQIRQADLGTMGISGTPTILLVDKQGKVLQQWIGFLSPSEESDVAAHLGIKDFNRGEAQPSLASEDASEQSPLVDITELRRLIQQADRINLVDVRSRLAYSHGRVAGAINIPIDELEVRASHELLLSAPIVLFCDFSASCAASGMQSLCSRATTSLGRVGFGNVRVVRDPLTLLRDSAFPIQRSTPDK